jgi:hypothetical protein
MMGRRRFYSLIMVVGIVAAVATVSYAVYLTSECATKGGVRLRATWGMSYVCYDRQSLRAI